MLTLTVNSAHTKEMFDEFKQEFIPPIKLPEVTLELEHSLVSLSKWEAKWEIPFLGDATKTEEQTLDYIRCMTMNDGVPEEVYGRLSNDDIRIVSEHINSKMSATWFADKPSAPGRKEVITAEVIYYWLIALTIPFECQNWHLNKLLTLIKVCNQKNAPEKKMSRSELIARNRELNASRQKQHKTTG